MESSSTTREFISLPDEILLRLLGFLPNVDLHRCRLVHPMLKELVDGHPTPQMRLTVTKSFLGVEAEPENPVSAAQELREHEEDLIAWSGLGEQNHGSEMQGPFQLFVPSISGLIDHTSWRLVDHSDVHFHSGKLIILSHAFSHIHSPDDHPESFVPIHPGLLQIDLNAIETQQWESWVQDQREGSHTLDHLPSGVQYAELPERTIAYRFLEDYAKLVLVSMDSQNDSLQIRLHLYSLIEGGLQLIRESSPIDLGFPRFCRCAILSSSGSLIVHITQSCATHLSQQDPVQTRPLSEMLVLRCPKDLKSRLEKLTFSPQDTTIEGLRYSAPTMVLLDEHHLAVVTLTERRCCFPPEVKIAILDISGAHLCKVSEITIPRDVIAKHNPNHREVHLCVCCARYSIYFIRATRLRILHLGNEQRLVCSINAVNRFFAGDCSFDLGPLSSLFADTKKEEAREWKGDVMMEWDQSQTQAWSHPAWGNKFFGECFSAKQKDFLWSFGYNIPNRRLLGIESDPRRAKWLGIVDKEDTSASWKGGDRERYQPIRQYRLGSGQYVPYEGHDGSEAGVVPVLGSSFGPKTGTPSIVGVDEKRIIITSRSEESGAQALWICNIPEAMAAASTQYVT